MTRRSACLSLVLSCVFLATASARAADWPQWRGPNRDGVSKETGLLKQWPAEGPKLLWQAGDVGGGYSTPAVVGERLYVISSKGEQDESVQARNVADGKVVWSVRIGKVGPNTKAMNYPGSRSTPTVVGDVLYALGSDGDLACMHVSDGKVRWKKNLRTDFGGRPGQWAFAERPLVDGDTVVVTPGGPDATIVALDRNSGATVWKSAVPGGDEAAYSSIVIADAGGAKQYVQFVGKGLVGVDARTGKFLWRYDQTAQGSPANIPTPVARDGYVYSATGRGGGGLVKINVSPEGATVAPVYFDKKLPNAIGGAVLVGDHMFGTGQVLMCVQFATGNVKWTDRSVGAGSVLLADGRLYVHGESGEVALVEASPDEYRELGRFTPPGQPERGRSKAWAYPVVANGRLYLRDMNVLWCYDVKDAGAAGR